MIERAAYAFNKAGEKIFCKVRLTYFGLFIDYYVPKKNGFSVIWHKGDRVRICGVKDTLDGRKTIVSFHVHPTYWLSTSFVNTLTLSREQVIDDISNYINLHI